MKLPVTLKFMLLFFLTSCGNLPNDKTTKSSREGLGDVWEGIGLVQIQPLLPDSVFSDWDTLNTIHTLYCLKVKVQQLDGNTKHNKNYIPNKFCVLANNDTILPFEVIQESVLDAYEDRFMLAFEIPKGSTVRSVIYADSIIKETKNLNYLQ